MTVLEELVQFITTDLMHPSLVNPRLVDAYHAGLCIMCSWEEWEDQYPPSPIEDLITVECNDPSPHRSDIVRTWTFCRDRAACQLRVAFL